MDDQNKSNSSGGKANAPAFNIHWMDSPLTRLKILSEYEFQIVYIGQDYVWMQTYAISLQMNRVLRERTGKPLERTLSQQFSFVFIEILMIQTSISVLMSLSLIMI